jgi:hypothetical protein
MNSRGDSSRLDHSRIVSLVTVGSDLHQEHDMTQDIRTARERMKRRLNGVRAKSGYTFKEPDKVMTKPSSRTLRKDRIKQSLRTDKFSP